MPLNARGQTEDHVSKFPSREGTEVDLELFYLHVWTGINKNHKSWHK